MTRDDETLAELRRALDAVDGSRDASSAAAKAAFAWRTIDVELAELSFDSNVDDPDVVLRSGATEIRRLSFTAAAVTIEIETGPNASLMGQVVPAAPANVRLIESGGSVVATTTADEHGIFTFDELPASPICLECVAPDGAWIVRTSWIIV